MEPNSIEKIVEIDSHIGKWKGKLNLSCGVCKLTLTQVWIQTAHDKLKSLCAGIMEKVYIEWKTGS